MKKKVKKSSPKAVASKGGLDNKAFSRASGMLALIALIFYALFVWFGGYNGGEVSSSFPISFAFDDWTFLFGIVQAYAIWYVAGWIFVEIYHRNLR